MKLGLGLSPCIFQANATAPEPETFNPYSQGFFTYFWNWTVDYAAERIFQDYGTTPIDDTEQPVQVWREQINNGELGGGETTPQSESNGAVFGYDASLFNGDGLTHDGTQNFLLMWRFVILDDDVTSTLFTFQHQGESPENTYQVYYDYLDPRLIAYVGEETSITLASPTVGQPLYCYFSRVTDGETFTISLGFSADFGETWVTDDQTLGTGFESSLGCYVGLGGNHNNSKISSIGYGHPTDEAAALAQIAGVSQYWKATYDTGG